MATPYEKPLDTAKDVLESTDEIYICRGMIIRYEIDYLYKKFFTLGGTDQVYFSTTTHPEHHQLFLLANSTKYGQVF